MLFRSTASIRIGQAFSLSSKYLPSLPRLAPLLRVAAASAPPPSRPPRLLRLRSPSLSAASSPPPPLPRLLVPSCCRQLPSSSLIPPFSSAERSGRPRSTRLRQRHARGPCRRGCGGIISMRGTYQDGSTLSTPLLCSHGRALAQRPPPLSWRKMTMANSQVQPVGRRKLQGRQEKSFLLVLLHHCIPRYSRSSSPACYEKKRWKVEVGT